MTVRASVLLCTYRWGGLDVSFAGLSKQDFVDYEVILCDVFYKERKQAVEDYVRKHHPNLPLVHMEPFRNQYPLDSGSKHRNSAIAMADGELCIFLCDYAFVKPDYVLRHWNHYQKNHNGTSMAPHRYWMHPSIKPDYMGQPISVFETEFTESMLSLLPLQQEGQDPKLTMPAGPIGPTYLHLKNESMATDTLLYINGCDEGYDVDGGHCYSDSDLGIRCEVAGNGFILDPENIAEIVQVRDFYPILQRNRSTDADLAYFRTREHGGAIAPREYNNFNLRQLREEMLATKSERATLL